MVPGVFDNPHPYWTLGLFSCWPCCFQLLRQPISNIARVITNQVVIHYQTIAKLEDDNYDITLSFKAKGQGDVRLRSPTIRAAKPGAKMSSKGV